MMNGQNAFGQGGQGGQGGGYPPMVGSQGNMQQYGVSGGQQRGPAPGVGSAPPPHARGAAFSGAPQGMAPGGMPQSPFGAANGMGGNPMGGGLGGQMGPPRARSSVDGRSSGQPLSLIHI